MTGIPQNANAIAMLRETRGHMLFANQYRLQMRFRVGRAAGTRLGSFWQNVPESVLPKCV
jgi:hypothetical protein